MTAHRHESVSSNAGSVRSCQPPTWCAVGALMRGAPRPRRSASTCRQATGRSRVRRRGWRPRLSRPGSAAPGRLACRAALAGVEIRPRCAARRARLAAPALRRVRHSPTPACRMARMAHQRQSPTSRLPACAVAGCRAARRTAKRAPGAIDLAPCCSCQDAVMPLVSRPSNFFGLDSHPRILPVPCGRVGRRACAAGRAALRGRALDRDGVGSSALVSSTSVPRMRPSGSTSRLTMPPIPGVTARSCLPRHRDLRYEVE